MKISTKQYINSLYEACGDTEIQKLLKEAEFLRSNIFDVNKLLMDPNISWSFKEKKLKDNNVSEKIINFLKIIYLNKDTKRLDNILKSFLDLINQKANIEEVLVTTSEQLEISVKEEIKKELENKFNKKIILKEIIDEKIIGGIIIKINDKLYDNSIISKLNKLKNNLTK